MKKIFKGLICGAIALCLILLSTMTAFALEYNRNEQIKYLSEEEKYDYIWKSFTYGQLYELNRCKENDDFLTLSIAKEELKSFVSTLNISSNSSTDYTVANASSDFTKFLQKKYSNIMPYSEEVIKYMKSHPNANLQWSYDNDTDRYTVSDNPSAWNCTVAFSGTYMQYSNNDVSNILIWTYDKGKDKYICKDRNGKTVNSVAKYHLEDETKTSKSDVSSETTSKHTTDYSTVINPTETASSDVSENTENNEVTAVEDSMVSTHPDSPSTDDNSNQIVTAESAVEEQMESSVVEVVSNNGNNVQNVILIVLGVLIVAGIGIIIVMLKKKGKKNES